jgi:hypothetical protein
MQGGFGMQLVMQGVPHISNGLHAGPGSPGPGFTEPPPLVPPGGGPGGGGPGVGMTPNTGAV